MTKAKIQPFLVASNNNIGHFNGKKVYLRSVTERNKTLSSYINHFCLMWKSDGVSFQKTTEELKSKHTIGNNRLSFDNVKSFFKV